MIFIIGIFQSHCKSEYKQVKWNIIKSHFSLFTKYYGICMTFKIYFMIRFISKISYNSSEEKCLSFNFFFRECQKKLVKLNRGKLTTSIYNNNSVEKKSIYNKPFFFFLKKLGLKNKTKINFNHVITVLIKTMLLIFLFFSI